MLVALAGPSMNLIIAFIVMFLWFLTLQWLQGSEWSSIILLMLQSTVLMNLGLGVFNLLPIPPLDGFAVLGGILPARFTPQLHVLEQYGMIILIILLLTNILGKILSPVVIGIFIAYQKIIILILTPFLG
jgi:Zn-dependent protease